MAISAGYQPTSAALAALRPLRHAAETVTGWWQVGLRAAATIRALPKTSAAWLAASRTRCQPVRLRDGRLVRVRPARPADDSGLLELYAALTPESRYRRFFTAGSSKSRGDARRLAAAGRRSDHVFVAVADNPARIVAVAQLAGTETALTVRDDYQGVGLGGVLLTMLLQTARTRGVPSVEATVLADNARVLRLLRRHHAALGSAEGGVLTATMTTDPAGHDQPVPAR